jgi:hypothetical protein
MLKDAQHKASTPRHSFNAIATREKSMREWSEYFENFPEENPANWVNGQFNPRLAADLKAQETNALLASAKTAEETAKLKETIARMVEEGNARTRAKN